MNTILSRPTGAAQTCGTGAADGATPARSAFGERLYQGLDALPGSRRFSAEQLEVIYAMGYAHIVQQQYAQALPVFAFLSQYGPTRKHYLCGLALCLQMLKRHDEALRMYSLVLTLFPDAADAAVSIAECELALGQFEHGRRSLEAASAIARENPVHARAGERAQALAQLLNRSSQP